MVPNYTSAARQRFHILSINANTHRFVYDVSEIAKTQRRMTLLQNKYSLMPEDQAPALKCDSHNVLNIFV